MRAIAILVLLTGTAAAGDLDIGLDSALGLNTLLSWSSEPPSALMVTDWAAVRRCAESTLPGYSHDHRADAELEYFFQTVNYCRLVLAARHIGWVASGRPADEDPEPPAPMSRPDDMKSPISCDFSKLSSNGSGVVTCNWEGRR